MTTKKQTEGEYIEVSKPNDTLDKYEFNHVKKQKKIGDRTFAYGLKGIQELFNVSHATAQKLKNGVLKDAVSQQGRIIIVDVDKAIELFSNNND